MSSTIQGAATAGPGRFRTFSSLRHRDYRYLWASSFFSAAGDWIQQLTMGWLMYELTRDPFLVGALAASRSIPFLFVGPISGVLSDRMDRRKLLMANQFFLAASASVLATLVVGEWVHPWHLFFFNVLNGAGFAFSTPLRQALIPQVVPRSEFTNAIALNSTAININRVTGPALGGIFIAAFGAGTNYAVQAGCYIAVALMVLQVRVESKPAPKPVAARPSPLSDMREGFAYVLHNRRLSAVILLSFIPSIFMMPFATSLMPVFSKEVLDFGPEGLGMLSAMMGAGGLTGTLIVATLSRTTGSDIQQVLAALSAGVCLIIFSQTDAAGLAIPFLIGMGIGQMVFITTNNTVVHSLVSDELRGRVLSLYLLNLGLGPIGGFMAGALADRLDAPTAMLIGGCTTIGLVLLIAVRFRMARLPWADNTH